MKQLESEHDWYDLKVGDRATICDGAYIITRVPTGWVFGGYRHGEAVFIPLGRNTIQWIEDQP